jgi:hypothetical protein
MGEVDRRKHDVDVIERVLGGVHEAIRPDEPRRQVIDVDVSATNGYRSSSVELIVNLSDERRSTTDRRRG